MYYDKLLEIENLSLKVDRLFDYVMKHVEFLYNRYLYERLFPVNYKEDFIE